MDEFLLKTNAESENTAEGFSTSGKAIEIVDHRDSDGAKVLKNIDPDFDSSDVEKICSLDVEMEEVPHKVDPSGESDTSPNAIGEKSKEKDSKSSLSIPLRPIIKMDGLNDVPLDSDFTILRMSSDRNMSRTGLSGIEDKMKWSGEVYLSTQPEGSSGYMNPRFLEVYQLSANDMLEVMKLYRKMKSQSYHETEPPTNKVSPIKIEKDDDELICKVHLQGLNFETTTSDLRDYFSKYGDVKDCFVVPNVATGKSRGFGFVTFRKKAIADKVIKGSPHSIGERGVKAGKALPRGGEVAQEEYPDNAQHGISVKGVTDAVRERDLTEHFGRYGRISSVKLVRKNRMAFIDFLNADGVDAAIRERHVINRVRLDIKRIPLKPLPTMQATVHHGQTEYPSRKAVYRPTPMYEEYIGHLGSRLPTGMQPIPHYHTAPPAMQYQPAAPTYQTHLPYQYSHTAPVDYQLSAAASGPIRNIPDFASVGRPAPYPKQVSRSQEYFRDNL